MGLALTLMYLWCTTDAVGSYIGTSVCLRCWLLHWCTTNAPLIGLALTLELKLQKHWCSWLLHWCTIGVPPMGLALTLMYCWCITNGVGSYTETAITKTLIVLALTLMYHWWDWPLHWNYDCKIVDGIGSYIDGALVHHLVTYHNGM